MGKLLRRPCLTSPWASAHEHRRDVTLTAHPVRRREKAWRQLYQACEATPLVTLHAVRCGRADVDELLRHLQLGGCDSILHHLCISSQLPAVRTDGTIVSASVQYAGGVVEDVEVDLERRAGGELHLVARAGEVGVYSRVDERTFMQEEHVRTWGMARLVAVDEDMPQLVGRDRPFIAAVVDAYLDVAGTTSTYERARWALERVDVRRNL